jgi:uncharacterized lipoprotein YehR (DUF1307 family)
MFKKILLVVFVLVIFISLIGCEKKTTIPNDEIEFPFVDENGKLNVDVSDHVFE